MGHSYLNGAAQTPLKPSLARSPVVMNQCFSYLTSIKLLSWDELFRVNRLTPSVPSLIVSFSKVLWKVLASKQELFI